ncbi:EAL domain-containing protein [Alteromonas sp. A079]|uniref:GGDEF/EAL domain-containing response regulator n=1 Tax=Alteromonas sp. A079 TaxID=3410268 RepID=UPI003B9FB1C4
MPIENIIDFNVDAKGVILPTEASTWKVLSVEDDINYQRSISLSLRAVEVMGRELEVLTANSATQAASILSERDDIAVILLDVVMESDDAGLYLVDTIRRVIGNDRVRIVLLTGQPGVAPQKKIMQRYDIDEYWTKTDTTEEKLHSIVTSNIRTWQSMTELYHAKRGLQMIVDASRVLTSKENIEDFTQTVLHEISKLVGVSDAGGIVCAYHPQHEALEASEIFATSGNYRHDSAEMLNDIFLQKLNGVEKDKILSLLRETIRTQEHNFSSGLTALYFSTTMVDERSYIILVESPEKLKSSHIALLQVFCENVSNGFTNLALLNKLSQLAYFDSELHIPNKNWLVRELEQLNTTNWKNSVLVLVDISNFSDIAVMLGRSYAEEIVRALYQKIKAQCVHTDAICRIRDNTFAFIFPSAHAPSKALLNHLSDLSVDIDGLAHTIMSVVCKAELHLFEDCEPQDIITISELSIAEAREKGQSVTQVDSSIATNIAQRHQVLLDLYQALQSPDTFQLALQPKVNMVTNEVVGAEALIRWVKPNGENVPPSAFIPIAEASGLMGKIDVVVMEKTFETIAIMQRNHITLPVSFNVTCSDITNPDFLLKLEYLLDSTKLEPSLLEVEITESQAMQDYAVVNPILQRLIRIGVKVSIDDFGTGYSSLAHIADLAVSTLKLDQSFVSKLSEEGDAGIAVCEMVSRLGERFHFNIIAEGVETEEQMQKLIDKGYTMAQGYYFGKPMMLDAFIEWLEKRAK